MSALVASDVDGGPRRTMYLKLAALFTFPTEQLLKSFSDGEWQSDVLACAQQLGFSIPDLATLDVDAVEYESEFIAMFEVGLGGAPCPLHSGHYARDRMRVMEEVLRFYRFFDYSPDRSADRFPDHVRFELEFMAHLAGLECAATATGKDETSVVLAQRDFVSRNLENWLPEFGRQIEARTKIEFLKQVGRLVPFLITQDADSLRQRVASTVPVEEGD